MFDSTRDRIQDAREAFHRWTTCRLLGHRPRQKHAGQLCQRCSDYAQWDE